VGRKWVGAMKSLQELAMMGQKTVRLYVDIDRGMYWPMVLDGKRRGGRALPGERDVAAGNERERATGVGEGGEGDRAGGRDDRERHAKAGGSHAPELSLIRRRNLQMPRLQGESGRVPRQ